MDEWIDVLDELGKKTGESALKSDAHRLGLWHRCFHCWVVGMDESDEPCLLVQRRAMNKDTWPGWLDVSVAGHLGSGEETLDGRRELEEEIGLSVAPERLTPLGERRVEYEIPQGRDREFHDVFLLIDHTPPEELKLQKEEVDAVISVKLEDAEAMASGEPVPAFEHKNSFTNSVRISLSDFVLGEDDYILRVISAAKRTLAGEPPGIIF